MTDFQRLNDEIRRAVHDAQASPVRWERVAVLRRRRALWGLTTLILMGIALTLLVSLGAFAGKSALDPSYRPPLLSNASGNVDLHEPELGWALFEGSAAGVSGYLMTADFDLHGLKNTKLVAKWIVRDTAGRKTEDSFRRLIVPRANSESRSIEQLVSRPEHTGLYRVRMILKPVGGKILDEDQTDAIYVIGTDCCRRYEMRIYTSLLPRGWRLDEDFAPNPGERFVTLARGPAENSLDIDTSLIDPENKGGNPLRSARKLEDLINRKAPTRLVLAARITAWPGVAIG